jgi:hypothetical protein
MLFLFVGAVFPIELGEIVGHACQNADEMCFEVAYGHLCCIAMVATWWD